MAIYHNSTKIIGRSNGRSAVGASAYRSGEKLYNEYDNTAYDFTRKSGVVYSEIMICKNAPQEFYNREKLWNEVEKIESSKNSQLAREVEVALPKELNREEQIQLVRNYVKDNFVNNGMCADVNIHDKGDGNPHAHIMLTMRLIKENGEWGAKQEKLYLLKKQGEKDIYVNSEIAKEKIKNEGYEKVKRGKSYKTKSVDLTNWNTKEFLQSYRKDWADKINEQLKEKGINERVDHRSYKEQGIEKEPTIHEGYIARKMEKRGEVSDRMEINREIKEQNNKLDEINKELKIDMQKLEELKREIERIEKLYKEKDINTLKEEKFKLQDKNKEIEKQLETIRKYRNSQKELSKYEKLKEQEKEKKKSYSIFKRSERKNSDSMINRYENAIKGIKNDLIGALKSGNVTDEEIQKINNENLILKNQIEQLENEIKLREQQEKEIKEQLEKELKDIEESKKQRIPMEFREKDKEENEPKNNKNKIDEIKDVYIKLRKQEMEYPALKDDKEHQEKLKQAKELAFKYSKPNTKEKDNNKNFNIERR